MSARHDALACCFRDFAREAGHRADAEQQAVELPQQRVGQRAATRVADVRIMGCRGEPTHLIDVAVTATAHRNGETWHVATRGVAVAREERRKRREWGAEALLGFPAVIVPAVAEAQGRWGQDAIAELRRLAKDRAIAQAPTSAVDSFSAQAATLSRWRMRLAVTLQRGNALAALAAVGAAAPTAAQLASLEPFEDAVFEARP